MSTERDRDALVDGHGLVGGRGDIRAEKRRFPPYDHRYVYQPYDTPAHEAESRAFFSEGPVEVEIGFGRGHFLRDRVRQARDRRFLGFEIRRAWVSKMARFLDREGLEHTRLVHDDARPLLTRLVPEGHLAAAYVFFPDPWWKKRHHKRRVMSESTLELLHRLLVPGGAVELRTDVEDYAAMVQELFDGHTGFEAARPGVDDRMRPLPLTHREKKCAESGAPIHRLRVHKRG